MPESLGRSSARALVIRKGALGLAILFGVHHKLPLIRLLMPIIGSNCIPLACDR